MWIILGFIYNIYIYYNCFIFIFAKLMASEDSHKWKPIMPTPTQSESVSGEGDIKAGEADPTEKPSA